MQERKAGWKNLQGSLIVVLFSVFSIGREILDFMLTRTKAEFGLKIQKDRFAIKDFLSKRKFIFHKMQRIINEPI